MSSHRNKNINYKEIVVNKIHEINKKIELELENDKE